MSVTVKAYGQMNQIIEFVTQERPSALGTLEVNADENSLLGQGLVSIEVNAEDQQVYGQGLITIEVAEGEGFLILADLIQTEISGPTLGSYAHTEINARLTVNGTPVPITSFNYQVPTGKLGSLLNVRLQGKDVATVPNGADVDFELVINSGGTEVVYKLMENGKLQGRSSQVSIKGGKNAGPSDEINFSAMDVIADKFTLSPRRPIIMFDPRRVKYDEVNVRNVQDAMRDEQGRIILPVLEPVSNLRLYDVMKRAYTPRGGLGRVWARGVEYGAISGRWSPTLMISESSNQLGMDFTKVVTNIKNYPVKRADFPVEGSWHDGVRPFVDMLAPMFFVIGTSIFVIDVERKLPYPSGVHTVTLGDHKRLTEQTDFKPDQNAVILTYQYSGTDPGADPQRVYRLAQTKTSSVTGSEGEVGYSLIETTRWDREYYMSDDPDNILDTLPVSVNIRTYQTTWYGDADGVPRTLNSSQVTHEESIDYEYEGELKVGHSRSISATIPLPVNEWFLTQYERVLRLTFMKVLEERCTIEWTDDPKNPGTKIQAWSKIETNGVCYIADETEDLYTGISSVPITVRRFYPALEFAEAGRAVPEMEVTGILQPIATEKESLTNIRGNQYDVERIEINHLTNTIRKSFVDSRPGTTSSDPYSTRTRNVLLRDTVSEAEIGPRVPVSVNAYELPRIEALELGARVLKRLSNPAKLLPLDIPGVDLLINRGTVIQGQRRDGTYGSKYIVTGYSITGENLGRQGHRIFQNIESIELLAT